MAAAHETTLVTDLPLEKLQDIVSHAVQEVQGTHSGFWVEQETSASTVLRHGISCSSWGERITITPEYHSIRVVSECTAPLQVIDWGKNRKNVELVRSCLTRTMAAADNDQSA